MTAHKISRIDGQPLEDVGLTPQDDENFRKLAEEAQRPPVTGAPVFRPAAQPRPAIRDRVANLPVPLPRLTPPDPRQVWESLNGVTLDALRLERNGLFVNPSAHPAANAFDILRTRILLAMQENGWRRIAVTSPTQGCGSTLVAANLALSLARRPDSRTLLVDLDLRNPGLATTFGLNETNRLRAMLQGAQPIEAHMIRAGRTLALGLNGHAEDTASEILQSAYTADTMTALIERLDPEVAIFDMPPALVADDLMAALPLFDAVLLVASGTVSRAEDITACERLFADHLPLIGVVLNRSQDLPSTRTRWRRRR